MKPSVIPLPRAEDPTEPTLRVDLEGYQIRQGKRRQALTKTECAALALLLHHAGRTLTREQILNTVWGRDAEVGDASVDNVIARLRARLHSLHPDQRWIETVRGTGYRWSGPDLRRPESRA